MKFDRLDWLWLGVLLGAALVLYTLDLGNVALRDWDEGTVAQVALDLARHPQDWLYPSLGGKPYLNKPPLIHLLIAWTYHLGGVNEWTTRLPSALLSALAVPWLYILGRELLPQRPQALFSALTYLTLLPVVRHGRLAMLDGPALGFALVMTWCLLRARRDQRWFLGAGVGLGLVMATKGILGLLLVSLGLIFLALDTPRLLGSPTLWGGLLVGSSPILAWYAAQIWHYGPGFLQGALLNQAFGRVWTSIDHNTGPPWYYLGQIGEMAWPWLIFWPAGLRRAWEHRNLSWGVFILVWCGVYLGAVSLMQTKLPWYVLPIYPGLALAGGVQMNHMWRQEPWLGLTPRQPYHWGWTASLVLLSAVAGGGWVYFGFFAHQDWLGTVFLCLAGACVVSVVLVNRGNPQFLPVMVWGTYLALVCLVSSNQWLWELAEAYPVKPVAALVRQHVPAGLPVYTSFSYSRPSLDFYSDHSVTPAPLSQLADHLHRDPHPYLLVDPDTLKQLNYLGLKVIGSSENWFLITHREP